ncbi:MAG: hypothetical protein SNJ66_08710 [Chloroherpetonaceae bacterium]
MTRLIYVLALLTTCSCSKINNKPIQIEIEKKFEVRLSEKQVIIGNIFQCIATNDSHLVILDIEASDIKQFDFNGNYVTTLVRRGDSPSELLAPRGFGLNDRLLLVADFATNSTKVFNRKGEYVNNIFPDGYSVVMGNIRLLKNGNILHGASSDTRGYVLAGAIIDTNGKFLEKCAEYPSVYRDYKRLIGIYYCDANSLGDYVISFAKSPDLYLGSTRDKSGFLKKFDEKLPKYISDKRLKDGENALKVEYDEFINLCIYYVSDSLIVRGYGKTTPEAEQSKSFLLFSEKKVEFFNQQGEFISEVNVQGRLLGTYNNYLIFEEDDTPNNRIIGFYKFTLKRNNSI